jgi:hypothetical protein
MIDMIAALEATSFPGSLLIYPSLGTRLLLKLLKL